MTILHPILLASGLALVALPIIIHLLMRRRRRPVKWGAMRFLLEAYRKQRRRMALEQILLLASRCLLVALLALAIARPLLGAAPLAGGARTLVLLIDNSLTSALADDQGVSDLDRSKKLASEALARLDTARGDRAALIALAGPADPVVLPVSPDIAGVTQAVEALRPADSAMDLRGAIDTLDLAITGSDEAPPTLVVLSAFREGSGLGKTPIEAIGRKPVRLLVSPPDDAPRSNVAVVGVEPMRALVLADASGGPLGVGQVRVLLRRSGNDVGRRAATAVRLLAEAPSPIPLASASVRWEPGQSDAAALLTLDPEALARAAGAGEGVVLRAEIDPDALDRDNVRRHALEVRDALRVAIVSPGRFTGAVAIDEFTPADWVSLALRPGDASVGGIDLEPLEPGALGESRLARLDVVVLARPDLVDDAGWDLLAAFTRRGGLLVLLPPPEAGAQLWTDRATRTLDLPWSIDREAREYGRPMGVRAPEGASNGMLAMIAGELDELARPVRVARLLPVAPEPGRDEDSELLLEVEDGAPLVIAARPGADARGLVVLLATSIDPAWTDLPTKPLLVPLLQEIVRQGAGRARGSYTTDAGAPAVAPSGAVALDALSAGAPPLPLGDDGVTREAPRRAGAWLARGARAERRGVLVVNPDTSASRVGATTASAVEQALAPITPNSGVTWIGGADAEAAALGDALGAGEGGEDFAWMLLFGAIGLALVEIALARLGSHAELRDSTPTPNGAQIA
ncbi:MAG: BatA domain-containing protein [Phycisphaerales bacterium]